MSTDHQRRLAAVRSTGLLDTAGEEAFDQLTRLAARLLDAPFAFVTIVDDTRSFWKSCFGITSTDIADRQNPVEESFCQYVVSSGAALVVGNTVDHDLTSTNPSNDSMGVRAWAGYPIRDREGNVLGTVCAVDTVERTWSDEDREVLRLLADAASTEIQLRTEVERTEAEAARLRQSLLPPKLDPVPGVALAALHRSANGRGRVLGDFYDLFASSRGRWHAVIGDVCGHGAEAAKFTSLVRWTYQAMAEERDDPGQIFTAVNSVLRRQPASRFVTAQALSFTTDGSGGLHGLFTSAGHHPAVVRRVDGSVEIFAENGWLLGVFEPLKARTTGVELRTGDRMVLFTDGVIEARRGDEQLGFDAVVDHIASFGDGPIDELTHSIVRLASEFAEGAVGDDMAVMVLQPEAID